MPGGNGFRGSRNPIILGQGRGPFRPEAFFIPFRQPVRYTITGPTVDSTGAPLPNCQVMLFSTSDKVLRAESMSDANGNYLVDGQLELTYFIVWYKSGAPDVAGTSVNTLVAVPA